METPEGYTGVVAKETGIISDGTAEFSYPTVVATADEDTAGVWCSYTWQRRGIAVVRVVETE